MSKKDLILITIIGAAVGVLAQPVIANLIVQPSAALRIGLFLGFLVLAPLALFIAYVAGRVVPVLYQFAKFAAVGTLNSFVDVGVLNLGIFLSGITGGLGFSLFKAISFLAATTNSFFWNKYWTFSATSRSGPGEVVKFYVVAMIGGIVNVGIASFIVNGVTHSSSISPALWANIGALAGVASALLWDFLGYKYLVFKRAEPAVGDKST